MFRDTHLQIDLNKLKQNVNSIQNYIDHDVILGAVLKANAYGHGLLEIADYLYGLNINHFLVATLSEALDLRKECKDYKILIMGHTPDKYLEHIVLNNITGTVFTLEQAKQLDLIGKQYNKKVKIHLKIETGFNRLGIQINEQTVDIIKKIAQLDYIIIEGAFTHLALKNKQNDQIQAEKFLTLMEALKLEHIKIPIQHIVDSIGMVLYPELHLDMVRVGALLYGLQSEEKGVLKIEPILSFHTKISHQKVLTPGECISYGNRYVCDTKTNIATLPFGYSDGYPRNMYQKGEVTINNKRYPIVGVICMDQCMINLGQDSYTDEDVIIIADGNNNTVSINELAQLAETNKNEIVSRFTTRVPRVYLK